MDARAPECDTPHNTNRGAVLQQRSWLPVLLLLCAIGSLWFIRRDALTYLTLSQPAYTDYYWPWRYGLFMHICGGILVLGVGLTQLYLGLSGRTRTLHRWLGRLYVAAVLLAAAAALYLLIRLPPSAYSLGLLGLAGAWIVTTGSGYLAVIRGRIASHRLWMLRSYLVTFGFVTFRLIVNVLTATGLASEDGSDGIAAWVCWAVPLALFEILRRRRSLAASPAA